MQKIKFQDMIPKRSIIEKYNSCIKDDVRNNIETWKIIN